MKAAIHEMRNHLCVAMAGIEAFMDRKLEPNDARLSAVFQALREVDLLIADLPDDKTVEFSTHILPIDVCGLIAKHVAAMEGYAAEREVTLVVKSCTVQHDRDARFFGDPGRIAEIVTNVLMNAVRHTPRGGEVHVDFRRDSASLRLCICDEGPGIVPEERERIFERGFCGTSVTAPPGSGIGLALVKEFVDRQGGTITVASGPRCGASFTIRLPGMHVEDACQRCGNAASRGMARANGMASTAKRCNRRGRRSAGLEIGDARIRALGS